jgi:putative flippase GtrA
LSTIAKVKRQILEILGYLWIAGVATLVNLLSGAAYRELLGMNYKLSYAVSYFTGMIVGFILSKLYSFKERTSTNTSSESIKYVLVTLVAFSVTYTMSLLFRSGVSVFFEANPDIHNMALQFNQATHQKWINRDLVANMLGIGVGFFVNFFGHKFLTFRKTNAINRIRRRVIV